MLDIQNLQEFSHLVIQTRQVVDFNVLQDFKIILSNGVKNINYIQELKKIKNYYNVLEKYI